MKVTNWEKASVIILGLGLLLTFLRSDGLNKNIENTNISNYGVNNGLMAGRLELTQNYGTERNFNEEDKERLVSKIKEFELDRGKSFNYLVVSASPDGESQKFAKKIITYLSNLDNWETVSEPIIVFDRNWEPSEPNVDVAFNISDPYDYKNSLEIIVLDQ